MPLVRKKELKQNIKFFGKIKWCRSNEVSNMSVVQVKYLLYIMFIYVVELYRLKSTDLTVT